MIGGFIQHEQRGFEEEGAGERDPHPPAAGEVVRGAALHLPREAQTRQDPARLGLRRVSIDRLQLLIDLVEHKHKELGHTDLHSLQLLIDLVEHKHRELGHTGLQ